MKQQHEIEARRLQGLARRLQEIEAQQDNVIVKKDALRRRLRAAGVFLGDSADRRAALPECE